MVKEIDSALIHYSSDPLGFGKGSLLEKLAQACGFRKTIFIRPDGCETKWSYCVYNLPPREVKYMDEGEWKVWKNPHPFNFPQYVIIIAATLCWLYLVK